MDANCNSCLSCWWLSQDHAPTRLTIFAQCSPQLTVKASPTNPASNQTRIIPNQSLKRQRQDRTDSNAKDSIQRTPSNGRIGIGGGTREHGKQECGRSFLPTRPCLFLVTPLREMSPWVVTCRCATTDCNAGTRAASVDVKPVCAGAAFPLSAFQTSETTQQLRSCRSHATCTSAATLQPSFRLCTTQLAAAQLAAETIFL